MSHWYLLVIPICFFVAIPNASAFDIGIDISTKCKVMIRNNLDSPCPKIEQILQLFPDTSPKNQVGDFIVFPLTMTASPTKREDAVNNFLDPHLGAVAHGG